MFGFKSMSDIRKILPALSLLIATVLSCEKPAPVDPIDPDPENECYYSVNGKKHEIVSIGLYADKDGAGYNLVMSDSEVGLCPDYDELANRAFNISSVDFMASTVGRDIKVGTDEISSQEWAFYVADWNHEDYENRFLDNPKSGSYRIDISGTTIKIDLSMKFADGTDYEVHYDGKYNKVGGYIWCGMLDVGSFVVDGAVSKIDKSTVYHDKVNGGYELVAYSGEQVIAVDFSELLVGKKSVVGKDDLNPKSDDNTTWSFMTVTEIDGVKVIRVDLDGAFEAGYFDCPVLTSERIDVDLCLDTADGHTLDLHYHGKYSVSDRLYR